MEIQRKHNVSITTDRSVFYIHGESEEDCKRAMATIQARLDVIRYEIEISVLRKLNHITLGVLLNTLSQGEVDSRLT